MKKLMICWLLWCCLLLLPQAVLATDGLTKISEHVHAYAGVAESGPQNSFGANAGIIIGDDAIMVVDTLISSKEGQRLLHDIKAVSDKPIRYVVNTHSHLDHTFGNSEFANLGALIISHKDCAAAMRKNGEATLANAANYGLTPEMMIGTELAYPSMTFQQKMEIDLGGVVVYLQHIAPSHSPGSILISIPADRVVFAGDILFTDFHPYMADGDIPGWLRNLDYIRFLAADKIIPGHGPISSKTDLTEMRDYLVMFDKKAQELAATISDPDAVATEMQKQLPARTQGQWIIKANLMARYLNPESVTDR